MANGDPKGRIRLCLAQRRLQRCTMYQVQLDTSLIATTMCLLMGIQCLTCHGLHKWRIPKQTPQPCSWNNSQFDIRIDNQHQSILGLYNLIGKWYTFNQSHSNYEHVMLPTKVYPSCASSEDQVCSNVQAIQTEVDAWKALTKSKSAEPQCQVCISSIIYIHELYVK